METTSSSVEALALLPVPDWADLSEQQGRGTACAWCGIILSTATAVDLGVRRIRVLDGHLNTYPRACRTCMRAKVQDAAAQHPGMCEHCATVTTSFDAATACDTAQALHQLVLEHGR
jgi:hypothetical protein